jgi:hypothetical protein
VASLLPLEPEARAFHGFNALSPGDPGQFAHTATTRASKRSSGTGSLSSSRAAMYP